MRRSFSGSSFGLGRKFPIECFDLKNARRCVTQTQRPFLPVLLGHCGFQNKGGRHVWAVHVSALAIGDPFTRDTCDPPHSAPRGAIRDHVCAATRMAPLVEDLVPSRKTDLPLARLVLATVVKQKFLSRFLLQVLSSRKRAGRRRFRELCGPLTKATWSSRPQSQTPAPRLR